MAFVVKVGETIMSQQLMCSEMLCFLNYLLSSQAGKCWLRWIPGRHSGATYWFLLAQVNYLGHWLLTRELMAEQHRRHMQGRAKRLAPNAE